MKVIKNDDVIMLLDDIRKYLLTLLSKNEITKKDILYLTKILDKNIEKIKNVKNYY